MKFKEFLNRVYTQIQVNVQEKIKVQKEVFDVLAKILARVAVYNPCFNFRVLFTGSSYEGLKIGNPDEFDYDLVNDAWAGKISLLMDRNTPVGYGYAEQTVKCLGEKFNKPGTKYLDAGKVRGELRNLVEKAMLELPGMKEKITKRPWEGGPAVTFEIRWTKFPSISIDLAIGLQLPHWPPNARQPPPAAFKPYAGVQLLAQLIPKVKHDPTTNTALWHISFAQVESKIMQTIDDDGGCRKKVLQLAKYFKGKSIAQWHPLATYHLKTILLHMNDDLKRKTDWAPGMLVPRFKEFIDRLLKHIRSASLPSFFLPGFNLFEGKEDIKSSEASVLDFLKTLKGNPQALLQG